ncbi:MAG: alpha/beta hydrolase fold domain-containing protein [Rikenellaceae bacterium]|nr:alpha/beta hydrolase fold domain-containing protein [Rikenellaceae bacterium]
MNKNLFILLAFGFSIFAASGQYAFIENIPYRDGPADQYQKERCLVDLYCPDGPEGFPTVVWFHGGGLTGGEKEIPRELKESGIAVAAANYRLSPRVHAPAYLDDAAAAVAWVVENIASYGGDPERIYVAGHSAGGYLTSMIALDKSYLAKYGIDADRIKGYMPVSGQTATHWQVCRERGDSLFIPRVDRYAPLSHVRGGTPQIVLTAGQSDLEMDNRTVENRYLYDALRTVGNDNVRFYEINGFDHGSVVVPSIYLLLDMIRRDGGQ